MNIIKEQKEICKNYGARYLASPSNLKVGVSLNVRQGKYPIHGLRHPMESDTTGWYIWSGEYSDHPDFFQPLHVEHMKEWCPLVEKFLGLEPGWRFLVNPDYEDVWQDLSLLDL